MNFNRIKGQEAAKRAIEIALAGTFTITLYGPPGSGKSMLIEAARAMFQNELKDHFNLYPSHLFFEQWPCPCGFYGHPIRECLCYSTDIHNHYRNMWRETDMYISVPHVSYDKLRVPLEGEPNQPIAERIIGTWKILEGLPDWHEIVIPDLAHALLKRAVDSLGLSAREYSKILSRAQVIAALDSLTEIRTHHVAEAIQYRAPAYSMLAGPFSGHGEAKGHDKEIEEAE